MKIGAVKATVHVIVSMQFNPHLLHSSDLGEFRYKRCPQNFRAIAFFVKIGAVKVIRAYMNVCPLLANFRGK
jgi:hypothetical protein